MANVSFALEKDLQEVFVDYLKNNICQEHNIQEYFKIGDYGIADIVTATLESPDEDGWIIDIYELKNRRFEIKDLLQITRYAKGLNDVFLIDNDKIRLNIVATEYDLRSDDVYLPDVFESKLIFYKSNISINGISFDIVDGYSLQDQTKQECDLLKKIKEDAKKQSDLYKERN